MNWNWNNLIEEESKESYFQQLKAFVKEERKTKIIYPETKYVFSAFGYTPFDTAKVVIIGQDPYPGQGQAHGLSFSCLDESIPPSLKNIFKEIDSNYFDGHGIFRGGNLIEWAQQGVLMLNTVLTVEKGKPGSHFGQGWETFTQKVVTKLCDKKELVWMLWGSQARAMASFITNPNHLVLYAAHPSPKSAENGFLGCGHFKECNEYLTRYQDGSKIGINWGIFKTYIQK